MEDIINKSYYYLIDNPETIFSCEEYIKNGFSINKDFDIGNITNTILKLLKAINSIKTIKGIIVYRGLNKRRFKESSNLKIGESLNINRFISTSSIKNIAKSHHKNIIKILLNKGTNAFFISSVNDLPGGDSRKSDLLIDNINGYDFVSLDGKIEYANGEEEILLGPGKLILVAPKTYIYK